MVSFSTLFSFMLGFSFGFFILVAFLLGQSTALCPNSPQYPQHLWEFFLIGLTCKEGIIIFLFIPTLDMLHSLVFVFQDLLSFWEVNILFSDHGKEFNKWVVNISSSIICPVFDNSVCFFSKKDNQSIGFCLTLSSP